MWSVKRSKLSLLIYYYLDIWAFLYVDLFFQILHLLARGRIAFIYIIKFNTKVFTVDFCYSAEQKVYCKNIHNILVKTFK